MSAEINKYLSPAALERIQREYDRLLRQFRRLELHDRRQRLPLVIGSAHVPERDLNQWHQRWPEEVWKLCGSR